MIRSLLGIAAAMTVFVAVPVFAQGGSNDAPEFVVVDRDTLWIVEPLVIVGSRVAVALPGPTRSVTIVSQEMLAELPARSIAEVLAAVPEVDVRQRQLFGVQADLSIRGSTFEQVQVLLDGVDVGDPQSGHHSLNLPLGAGDVGRLEVLPGHGASLYGANAFGGVVNVVSRTPADAPGGEIVLGGGEYGLRSGRIAVESGRRRIAGGEWRTRASYDEGRSDGDRPGTDFSRRSAFLRSRGELGATEVDLSAGWARRSFGAQDFYAPFDSWERTETFGAMLKLRSPLGERVVLEPTLSVRRHRDRFVLFRDDPDRYTNNHLGRRATVGLSTGIDAGYGLQVVLGAEGAYEDIDSQGVRGGVEGPALGRHLRRRGSGAWELAGWHGPVRWSLGGRLDAWQHDETRWNRSAAMAWTAADGVVLRASAGTVDRRPTFTELYYEDPANLGDEDLEAESGWVWDTGLDVNQGPWTLRWSFFERFENDLIDWVRPVGGADMVWTAANIRSGATRGWSQTAELNTPTGHRFAVHLAGTEVSSSLPTGFEGKYRSLVPRRRAVIEASLRLTSWCRVNPLLRMWTRRDGVGTAVADLSVAIPIRNYDLRGVVTNLLDRDYEAVPGVRLPGRLASVSIGTRF